MVSDWSTAQFFPTLVDFRTARIAHASSFLSLAESNKHNGQKIYKIKKS